MEQARPNRPFIITWIVVTLGACLLTVIIGNAPINTGLKVSAVAMVAILSLIAVLKQTISLRIGRAIERWVGLET